MPVAIRAATRDDLEFLLSLVPRLSEFGLPPSRDAKALGAFTKDVVQKTLAEDAVKSLILVAEQDGKALGFIQLEEEKEFFTGEAHGYIANLAIAKEAEGKGVGKALMQVAEAWSKERGYRYLSLYVFGTNHHARRFYETLGYDEDSLELTKLIAK
jgi:ribosomal protein S18 acetylase RimI-like enzyme